jgi:hypothetical protein
MRAVTEGLDSERRPLSAVMPRFRLEARDRANLAAFLRSRGRTAPVGVRDGSVSLAAVVTPDADPAQRRAMEAVLAHFRSHANPRRRSGAHGPRPLSADGTPERAVLGYRDWELSIWEIEGPPATWRAQLEKRQAARPVFALLSGLGGADWAPVHRFCEEHGIPCILPNVDAPPPSDGHGWWSVYYSAGVGVEADVMARSIPTAARVAQVFRPGTVGAAGAARLGRLRGVLDLEPTSPVPEGIDAIVLWLTSAEALRYAERGGSKLWISATAAGPEPALPAGATLVQAHAPTAETKPRRGGFDAWARARGVERGDFRIQEQTLFACMLFADALGHMRDDLDRELLIERIEHSARMEIFSASYSHLSFGTGQRFLSKGAHVTAPRDATSGKSEWVVP